MAPRRAILLISAASAVAMGCRTPTQITIEVRTDIPCSSTKLETSITVGTIGPSLEKSPPVTTTFQCENQRVGAIVVVPSDRKDAEIAIRVVTGVGKTLQQCAQSGNTGSCIVARRALHFIAHESLELPIDMSSRCKDVTCDAIDKTCVEGACVSATISDPGSCHGEGCAEGSLSLGTDAGVPDSTIDAAADALDVGTDAATDGGTSAEWAKQLGDRDPIALDSTVVIDKDGNAIVASSFKGTTNLGDVGGTKTSKGLHDILLSKIGRNGVVQWSKQLGSPLDDFASGVTVDPAGNILLVGHVEGDLDFGGGVVAATGSGDLFLAKYDASGAYLRARRLTSGRGGNNDYLAMDAAGNILLAGTTGAPFDFGGGIVPITSNQIFVAKFAPDLGYVAAKTFGGTGEDFVESATATSDGGIVIVGSFNDTLDFGTGPHTSAAGNYDAYIASFDTALGLRFAHTYGDSFLQQGQAVAVDSKNRIVMGGFLDGATTDFGGGPRSGPALYVVQLDDKGAHLSSKTYAATSYAVRAGALAFGDDGSVVVGGYLEGTMDFGGGPLVAPTGGLGDAFLAQFGPTGALIRARRFGDASALQGINALALDRSTGAFAMTGSFGGSLDLGFTALKTTGNESFVARVLP